MYVNNIFIESLVDVIYLVKDSTTSCIVTNPIVMLRGHCQRLKACELLEQFYFYNSF